MVKIDKFNHKSCMRKTFIFIFLYSIRVFACDSEKEIPDFKGNWTKSFRLLDGRMVIHTPHKVEIRSNIAAQSKNFLYIYHEGYNPNKPTTIAVNTSLEEFKKALKPAGYYDD